MRHAKRSFRWSGCARVGGFIVYRNVCIGRARGREGVVDGALGERVEGIILMG